MIVETESDIVSFVPPSRRNLIPVLLINSTLDRNVSESGEENDPTFAYSAVVDSIRPDDEYTFAFASLTIEKMVEGKVVVEFKASYIYGFSGEQIKSREVLENTVEHLLISVVWPRFRDLGELTATQAEIDMPRLPNKPNEVLHKSRMDAE